MASAAAIAFSFCAGRSLYPLFLPLSMRLFMKRLIAVILSVVAYPATEADEQQVQELLSKMTLEQKVGQMIQAEIQFITPEQVSQYAIGSVLNGGGSYPKKDKYAPLSEWLDLADAYYEASRNSQSDGSGIPLIWGTDAVHGHNNVYGATLFPHNIGLGATHNPSLVGDVAKATALEVRASGIDWIFAPTIAIAKDDRWGRTYESFSDQSALIEAYTPEIVEAIQSSGLAATAKHFIGDGGTQLGDDQGNAVMSLESLLKDHGAGYLRAIDEGVYSVMASFNSWNGTKIHGSYELLTEVLKEQLGFEGVVVSDWNGIGQVEGCTNSSCPQAINAGIDMIMVPELWREVLQDTISHVEAGIIAESRIDDAVTRILRMKFKLGLFEQIKPSTRAQATVADITATRAANRKLARESVRQSLVLLRNDQDLLPLDPAQHILIIGSADDIGKASGGWTLSWQGIGNANADFPTGSSIYGELKNQIENAGGTIELSEQGEFERRPDKAIIVFGEDPYAEGLGDVSDLQAPDLERVNKILRTLRDQGIPAATVFLTGRPMWINPVLENSTAFVIAWLPGSEGGGVADLLLRDAKGEVQFDFLGRLSFDWPNDSLNAQDNELPVENNLFPYGYGLSLASASLAKLPELKLEPTKANVRSETLASVMIFNARTHPDWELFLGEPLGWQQRYENRDQRSNGGQLRVRRADNIVQEDSLRLLFSGDGSQLNQWYWQARAPKDLSGTLEEESVLNFMIAVNSHPSEEVTVRMDCVYPCSATVSITKALEAFPLGDRRELAIPIRCFVENGLRVDRVDTPALLATTGALDITLSSVNIGAASATSTKMACD